MDNSEKNQILDQLKKALIYAHRQVYPENLYRPSAESAEVFSKRVDSYPWGMRSGLIAGLRDCEEDMLDFDGEEQILEFRRMLLSEHGIDLDKLIGTNKKIVKNILRRGHLQTADEYRILDGFVGQLAQKEKITARDEANIEKANEILAAAEKSLKEE